MIFDDHEEFKPFDPLDLQNKVLPKAYFQEDLDLHRIRVPDKGSPVSGLKGRFSQTVRRCP